MNSQGVNDNDFEACFKGLKKLRQKCIAIGENYFEGDVSVYWSIFITFIS